MGGQYPSERFLVIRLRGFGRGLFSYVFTTIGWIKYAVDNGMIPVVDMKTCKSIYHREGVSENVWERFFEQPCGWSLEKISTAKNVMLADSLVFKGIKDFVPTIGPNEDIESDGHLTQWRRITWKYLRPNMHAIDAFRSDELESSLSQGVVGVLARGTDYVKVKPQDHPVQPTAQELIEAVDDYCRKRNTALSVYLVTEDKSILDEFLNRYGSRLIVAHQQCVNYGGAGLLRDNNDVRGNLKRGLAYLRAIYDLARCDALIAGNTSGTIGAAIMSNGFKYSLVFNKGLY